MQHLWYHQEMNPGILELPGKIVKQIMAQAQQQDHSEICGLISLSTTDRRLQYYPIDNVSDQPARRFEMSPEQQVQCMRHMRENNESLLAIVHSHPDAPAIPSATDIAEIGYPGVFYIVVSLDNRGVLDMRAFSMQSGDMRPVELHYI